VDNVTFAQYEKQLQKLLDQHVITEEIIRLTEQIDILDTETFNEELEKIVGSRAKAEKIASATSKYINEKRDTDPVLYKKLSELIKQTIADMRANRLSDLEALQKLKDIRNEAIGTKATDIPEALYYKKRNIPIFRFLQNEQVEKSEESTLFLDELISENEIVDWYKNIDIINKIELDFGDFLMDIQGLTLEKADNIAKKCIEIAIANK
jgi:type I restriction enzyme R subunit